MRTVDPDLWCRRVRKRIQVTRPMRYGKKVEDNLESRVRRSFCDAMMEFWRNCSINGMRNIMDENTSPAERYSHVCVVVAGMLVAAGVVLGSYVQHRRQPPLLVTLQSAQHSVRHVPFPAVAICSYNVFSRRQLDEYTDFIYSKDHNHSYSRHTIRQQLLRFAALVTVTSPPVSMGFLRFLTLGVGENNVTHIMYRLSPRCGGMLRRCSWRGRGTACERLFAARVTPLGYCCVFNGRYLPMDYHNPPKVLDLVGQDNGLSAAVTEDSDDFTVLRKPAVGLEILLFDGSEYPLLEGGAVRALLAARDSSAYLALSATVQRAAGLDGYDEQWRGCRTGGSFSRCLAECRRAATAALCGCVPHTLLPREGDTVCTTTHLTCLTKYKKKMSYYYPGAGPDASLGEERTDSLECARCRPDCARVRYSATLAHSPYIFGKKIFRNFFSGGITNANMTVIRLFYSTDDQQLYTVETNLRWFEVISSLGSQWLALGGASLGAASQLLFHLLCRWPRRLHNQPRYTTSRAG